jgi:hypothetical protein
MPILPRELRDVLGKYIEELDEKLDAKTALGAVGPGSASGG